MPFRPESLSWRGALRGELALEGPADKLALAVQASGFSAERWGIEDENDEEG